jgi:hypothetical protein
VTGKGPKDFQAGVKPNQIEKFYVESFSHRTLCFRPKQRTDHIDTAVSDLRYPILKDYAIA